MSVNFLIGSAVACGHNTMADYEKYILTYQFSFNVCIFILYIRHISASHNFFSCNILSLLVLHGRSIWFFGVKCFCIVFHVWTCQLTTENLVMMNKVSYFQSSPLLSFLSNQDSAGETAYFTSLHQYRALFPGELTSSCQLCPAFKRDVKPFWNLRHEWFQGEEETRNYLCCDHYKSLMNESSEIVNPYMISSVVQALILLVHWWLYSQFAESILKPLVEVI